MKFTWNGKENYIDGYLADVLNSLLYNIKDDHDFIIIITGDRTVRVGKSVLGMTVCAYLAYGLAKLKLNLDAYSLDNVYFDNKGMLKKAMASPKYTIHHYDEGREGLAASKSSKDFQKDLLDFFAECGQLGGLFIIVLPDFFEMREEIAVGRSEFLLNVYRKETPMMIDLFKDGKKLPIVQLDRGYYEFFNRKRKAALYDRAKSLRRKSYGLIKANLTGRFTNQYPLDEEEYRKKKRESLTSFFDRHKEEKKEKNLDLTKKQKLLAAITFAALKEKGIDTGELARKAGIDRSYLNKIAKQYEKEAFGAQTGAKEGDVVGLDEESGR